MFHRRPLIGVCGPDRGGHAAWLFTRTGLFMAGARAVRISPSRMPVKKELDGLVLGGGADIDPERYGDIRHKADDLKKELHTGGTGIFTWLIYPLVLLFRATLSSKRYNRLDKERDLLELDLLAGMVSKDRPVLGICRGAQLINVHFGGTLLQDLSEFYTESPNIWSIFPGKSIKIRSGTRLAAATGGPLECNVNALHRQAVKDIGEDLQVTATESNGVIQAIEHKHKSFIVGVQWHPEYLLNKRTQRRLFQALVDNARKQKDEPGRKS